MHRIKSKTLEAQKKRKNQIIIGAILIFVMFGSVFGVIVGSFGNSENIGKVNYNNFKFVKQGSFWITEIGNYQFAFRYNPNEVQKINPNNGTIRYINSYAQLPLYIFSEDGEAGYEISNNLRQFVQRIQPACLNKTDCQGDYPIKNCDNNFIIIKKANKTEIYQQDNCVFIQSPKENITKTADEFLFNILGIR